LFVPTDVINALRGEDDIGTGVEEEFDAFLGDIRFALANVCQLGGIAHHHLHSECQLHLAQVDVEQSDLGVLDEGGHTLSGAGAVECIPVDELGFLERLAVRLEDVDGLDGVFHFALVVDGADGADGVHSELGKEGRFPSNDLARHRRTCGIEDAFHSKVLHLARHGVRNEFARLAFGQVQPRDHQRWVHTTLHQFVCLLQQLGGEDHHTRRTVTNLND
jgi:hypothetical protein